MSPKSTTNHVAVAAAGQHVALYCRISQDKSGRVEGVRNQEKWGRAYAAQHWPGVPVVVYADNDLSAADEGVYRPGFEELKAALKAGLVCALWTVEQSRLERTEIGWFTLAALLDAAGIEQVHTRRDGLVRVRDDVAGIKAVINAGEVRKLKKRVNDRLDANAAAGLPAGGRPLGYRHGRSDRGEKTFVIVEEEAAIIRECAERVLSGWSLTSIARDLNARGVHGAYRRRVRDEEGNVVTEDGTSVEDGGVPLTRDSTITRTTVKSWLTRPTIAGLRVHRGEIVGEGNWEPILDRNTWQALRAKLAGPRRVLRGDGLGEQEVTGQGHHRYSRAARHYLLTGGIAICAECGTPLVAQIVRGRPMYKCPPRVRGGNGCVSIMGDEFEAYVVDVLLAELDKPAFRRRFNRDKFAAKRDEITTGLAALDGQRAELAKMWARRAVTGEEWQIAREEMTAEERRLRAELAALPSAPPRSVRVEDVRARWENPDLTLDERREFISLYIVRVAVGRSKPGHNKGFDSARVAAPKTWWRHA